MLSFVLLLRSDNAVDHCHGILEHIDESLTTINRVYAHCKCTVADLNTGVQLNL